MIFKKGNIPLFFQFYLHLKREIVSGDRLSESPRRGTFVKESNQKAQWVPPPSLDDIRNELAEKKVFPLSGGFICPPNHRTIVIYLPEGQALGVLELVTNINIQEREIAILD